MSQSRIIFKYPLRGCVQQTLGCGPNAKLLTIQMQGETPTAWVEQDAFAWNREGTTDPVTATSIEVLCIGTGHDFFQSPGMRYVSTMQHDGCVWHFYQV